MKKTNAQKIEELRTKLSILQNQKDDLTNCKKFNALQKQAKFLKQKIEHLQTIEDLVRLGELETIDQLKTLHFANKYDINTKSFRTHFDKFFEENSTQKEQEAKRYLNKKLKSVKTDLTLCCTQTIGNFAFTALNIATQTYKQPAGVLALAICVTCATAWAGASFMVAKKGVKIQEENKTLNEKVINRGIQLASCKIPAQENPSNIKQTEEIFGITLNKIGTMQSSPEIEKEF